MAKEFKIKNFFQNKDVTDAVYYEAHKQNALFDEKKAFFDAVKAQKQYQDDYDYNVMQYRYMKLQDEYEGVERTSKELRMINQVKFMQAQLPLFTSKLSQDEYHKALNAFEREYDTLEEELGTLKKAFKEVLFLAAKNGLSEFQEKALIAALAKVEVDTTKADLSEVKLYDVQNEKKYVGVRKDRPKNDCPTYDVLEEQLPERMIESIATAIKQISKRAMNKRNPSEFTLEFDSKQMKRLAHSYANQILDSYKKEPARYTKECHSTMDVVNTFFDRNGKSRAKYKALAQDLMKYAEVKEVNNKEMV
jgi:hypothetical protein